MSITALIFFTVFFGLSILCLTRSPAYGIFLYEFVYFMNPQVRWWYAEVPHLRYSFIIIVLILAGYLARSGKYSDNKLSDIPQFKWLGALTIIILLSYLWSVDTTWYNMLLTRYLKYVFFIAFLYKVLDSRQDLDKALLVYMVGAFYICFIAWQMGRGGSGRLEGIGVPDGEEVNGTAAAVVTAVPMLVYMILFSSKKWMQFLALVGLTFVLNGLILLNSRGAFVATVVSVGWFSLTIFREKGLGSAKWKLAIGMIGGVCLFLYLADDVFWGRMQTLEHATNTETEGVSRVIFWMKTFEMLADHPFGAGGMGYQILSPQYLPAEMLSGGQRAVHSLWFETLSSYGYQGLVALCGYVLSTLLLVRKVKKYLREVGAQFDLLQITALESAFIAFLVAATFINRFYAEMLYWLPALIAVFANIYMIKPQRKHAGGSPEK